MKFSSVPSLVSPSLRSSGTQRTVEAPPPEYHEVEPQNKTQRKCRGEWHSPDRNTISRQYPRNEYVCGFLTAMLTTIAFPAIAQTPALEITVNSTHDGEIEADDRLTLREAIALTNGMLFVSELSNDERELVQSNTDLAGSIIEFDIAHEEHLLPIIQLVAPLPPLATRGLTIDAMLEDPGDMGFQATSNNVFVPLPGVAIVPSPSAEIHRGLTVIADNITIRGLAIYGFTGNREDTLTTPPAGIFIGTERDSALPLRGSFNSGRLGRDIDLAGVEIPTGTVIENNWIGPVVDFLQLDGETPLPIPTVENPGVGLRSAFGVYIFNGRDTEIRQNLIMNHDASGIITGSVAERSIIADNIIWNNGFAGMPDAIHLQGNIEGSEITGNAIERNGGSAIYLFKPEGSILIRDNTIIDNGLENDTAAIYLMSDGNEIADNEIRGQSGPGVVVSAFPRSDRNRILRNRFLDNQGLSIDLITQQNTYFQAFYTGDGPNPKIEAYQRRRQTGNFGIDAPQFASREFFTRSDGNVTLVGTAEPGSTLEIYRVLEPGERGPLNEAIATFDVDETGEFAVVLEDANIGDRVSATATHPDYGTSEPAINITIRNY